MREKLKVVVEAAGIYDLLIPLSITFTIHSTNGLLDGPIR
jgi:hypothetical protein